MVGNRGRAKHQHWLTRDFCHPKEGSFDRNVKTAPLIHEYLNFRQLLASGKAANRHHELCCGEVAENHRLPMISTMLGFATVPHFIRHIGKKSVSTREQWRSERASY